MNEVNVDSITPDKRPFQPACSIANSLPSFFDNAIGRQSAVKTPKARLLVEENRESVSSIGNDE